MTAHGSLNTSLARRSHRAVGPACPFVVSTSPTRHHVLTPDEFRTTSPLGIWAGRESRCGGIAGPAAPSRKHVMPTLLEQLRLPVLEDLQVVGWMQQALRDAAYHRQGVIAYGDKGSGRSEGGRIAVERFRHQQAGRHRDDPTYLPVQVRVIPPIRPQTRAELIRTLYTFEMGTVPPRFGRGGVDLLLAELVEGWQEENVAVVFFDETDAFGPGALDGCRDIIAVSGGPASYVQAGFDDDGAPSGGRAGAITGGGGRRPRGVGVVLVGVPGIYDRLRRSPEWGQRWRKGYAIKGLSPSVLAEVYRRMLPVCDVVAKADERAWRDFIRAEVAPRVRRSVRRVHSHIWEYVALCEQECSPTPATLEAVPFDAERFLAALDALAGSEGNPVEGDRDGLGEDAEDVPEGPEGGE